MELTDYFRFVAALIFVIALIALIGYLGRRYGLGYRTVARGTARRLSISEIMPLDAKRRLVLVRRDDREHLLLVGGECDVVVEGNIIESHGNFSKNLEQAVSGHTPPDAPLVKKEGDPS